MCAFLFLLLLQLLWPRVEEASTLPQSSSKELSDVETFAAICDNAQNVNVGGDRMCDLSSGSALTNDPYSDSALVSPNTKEIEP